MAASCTFTQGNETLYGLPVRKYTWAWTSHTDGTVSGVDSDIRICGTIVRVTTNPGATAPTDNYDITLSDSDGYDILAGQGANRDTANTESFCPGIAFTDGTTVSVAPIVIDSALTLSITNAGSGKQGTLVLYVR